MLDFLYTPGAKRALLALSGLMIILLATTNLLAISLLVAASIIVSIAIGSLRIRAIGLELVTFITIISALAYGPAVGAVLGVALIIIHLAIPQYSGVYVAWVVPEYAVAAFMAAALQGGVASVGIIILLILHAFNVFMTFLTSKEHFGHYLPYVITNIIFNVILFTQAGEAVVGMLK